MNVDVQIGVELKLRSEHHVGQVKEALPANPLPVVGHLRVAGDEHTGATARIGVLAKHRSHNRRRMGINKAVGGRVINIRRNLHQPVHLRRVGVGREKLDAARDPVGRVEHDLVLPHGKQRMSQTSDTDVRVYHLATDEAGRVDVRSDRVGRRTCHQAGPEHRVGGMVDELVGRPVDLRVVSGEPVVGIVDVELAAQRRLRVHAHLAQQPVVGTAVVGVELFTGVHRLGPGIHRLAKVRHKVGRILASLGIRLEGQQLLHVGEAARVLGAWPRGYRGIDPHSILIVQRRGVV